MNVPNPSEPNKYGDTNIFNMAVAVDDFEPFAVINGDAIHKEWVAAVIQEADGVRIYLSGVSRNFFVRGATVEETLELLK